MRNALQGGSLFSNDPFDLRSINQNQGSQPIRGQFVYEVRRDSLQPPSTQQHVQSHNQLQSHNLGDKMQTHQQSIYAHQIASHNQIPTHDQTASHDQIPSQTSHNQIPSQTNKQSRPHTSPSKSQRIYSNTSLTKQVQTSRVTQSGKRSIRSQKPQYHYNTSNRSNPDSPTTTFSRAHIVECESAPKRSTTRHWNSSDPSRISQLSNLQSTSKRKSKPTTRSKISKSTHSLPYQRPSDAGSIAPFRPQRTHGGVSDVSIIHQSDNSSTEESPENFTSSPPTEHRSKQDALFEQKHNDANAVRAERARLRLVHDESLQRQIEKKRNRIQSMKRTKGASTQRVSHQKKSKKQHEHWIPGSMIKQTNVRKVLDSKPTNQKPSVEPTWDSPRSTNISSRPSSGSSSVTTRITAHLTALRRQSEQKQREETWREQQRVQLEKKLRERNLLPQETNQNFEFLKDQFVDQEVWSVDGSQESPIAEENGVLPDQDVFDDQSNQESDVDSEEERPLIQSRPISSSMRTSRIRTHAPTLRPFTIYPTVERLSQKVYRREKSEVKLMKQIRHIQSMEQNQRSAFLVRLAKIKAKESKIKIEHERKQRNEDIQKEKEQLKKLMSKTKEKFEKRRLSTRERIQMEKQIREEWTKNREFEKKFSCHSNMISKQLVDREIRERKESDLELNKQVVSERKQQTSNRKMLLNQLWYRELNRKRAYVSYSNYQTKNELEDKQRQIESRVKERSSRVKDWESQKKQNISEVFSSFRTTRSRVSGIPISKDLSVVDIGFMGKRANTAPTRSKPSRKVTKNEKELDQEEEEEETNLPSARGPMVIQRIDEEEQVA